MKGEAGQALAGNYLVYVTPKSEGVTPVLLPRAAWGQGGIEPPMVGVPCTPRPIASFQGGTLSLREPGCGPGGSWRLEQDSGLCPPGGQGLGGRDRTQPWASSHAVFSSCCLRMVLAGCICQSPGPDLPGACSTRTGVPPSHKSMCMHTLTCQSHTYHSHTQINTHRHTHTILLGTPQLGICTPVWQLGGDPEGRRRAFNQMRKSYVCVREGP